MARKLAALTAGAGKPARPAAPGGVVGALDICLYAERPTYFYQGYGRRVVLMTRKPRRTDGPDISDFYGQAAALGNLKLAAFKANAAIADGRFTRAAIEQFLRQPTKSTLGEKT